MKSVLTYLPSAYENGAKDPIARQKMADAACLAGMAFANAFLGLNHSMAHKLGAYHHLPHGVANALILTDVMRYNASETPTKMGTFPQYAYPHTLSRYVECAHYCGIVGKNDQDTFEKFLAAIEDLKEKVGIKKTIKDYGIDEQTFLDTLDEMVENAFDDQCTGANPRYPLMSEIKEPLSESLLRQITLPIQQAAHRSMRRLLFVSRYGLITPDSRSQNANLKAIREQKMRTLRLEDG